MDITVFAAEHAEKLAVPVDPFESAFLSSYEKKRAEASAADAPEFDPDDKSKVNLVVESSDESCVVASVYACVLEDAIKKLTFRYATIMMRAGKFAVCVCDSRCALVEGLHRSRSRYTHRRGQGGLQSAHDNAKGKNAKSAGANLRRANERKLAGEFAATLDEFRTELLKCDRIFVSVSSKSIAKHVRSLFPKCIKVPFSTPEPSTTACVEIVKRMRSVVLKVVLRVVDECIDEELPSQTPLELAQQTSDAAMAAAAAEEAEVPFVSQRIHELCADFKFSADDLEAYLLTHDEDEEDVLGLVDELGNSALHVACLVGDIKKTCTLLEFGADPTKKNFRGKIAYHTCEDKERRDAFTALFREFRLNNLDEYDYEAVGLPPPALSEEEEAQRKAAKAEKNRRKKERAKRAQAIRKEADEIIDAAKAKTGNEDIDPLAKCDQCGGGMPRAYGERFHKGDADLCSLGCSREYTRAQRLKALEKRGVK